MFTGNHLAITALRGLPGVGKTTLAVELAHDPDVQEILVDGVLWVGLGRQPDVMAQLGRWATAVGISLHGIAELNTVEERANAIHDAIGRRRLLLVVDDAWCSEEAAAFKVGGPNCAYLITTRLPEVAIQFAGNNYTVVGELNEANSLALLTQLAPKIVKQEPDDALKLVQEVGGLPLGIILIGNYLCLKASCRHPRRIKDALKQLHNTEYRLRSISQPKSPLEHPGLSFGTKISLEAVIAVSDEALDQPSQYTLRALSVFPPKPNTFSEEAALAVTGQTKDILDRLTDAGLLEYSGNGRYTLHQTIADYARLKLTDEAVYQRMVNYFGGGSELGLHF
ncbi:hypothetical protein KFU94_36315 [Chloroflexi bacterium TSY]|nr:hypothetical protein [Chloroflexi bacterium TSY]